MNNSGYVSLRNYEKSIAFYEKSLAITLQIKDKKGEATSYNGLGNIYCELKNYKRMFEKYKS